MTATNRSGNTGRYFIVLNSFSEYGFSFEMWGRDLDRVTPRPVGDVLTVLNVIVVAVALRGGRSVS
ncbi:hypothetical protein F4560_004615 [Saccharothrix ecbatanensis]|uniref:Uncharacterized protein n=1 Tax=Saccharothrix ecbatanensis TaxID=1105145 RepID=A0A7W9HM72_9PSEU|nr:hypothetical protein [Saccharothrix ecbatanensis]MBB5804847.1 hypothetical protein [Saccharothrix ecbatanensis]